MDPIRWLAERSGLRECPYHPGVWVREDEPCEVCLAEAVESLREVMRDERADRVRGKAQPKR